MDTFRTFALRFLIVLFPISSLSLILINFNTLTKLELSLLSLLTIGLPWLFYILLLHHDHQSRANNALLRFCNAMEHILTGVNCLEKTTKESPKELMAELRVMQTILQQIAEERILPLPENNLKTKQTK